MKTQPESDEIEYSNKGFVFFCLPGLGLGLLYSGLYEIGLGAVFFGLVGYVISKGFWSNILFGHKNKVIRWHLIISNISCLLLGAGWFIMLPVLLYYFYYFCFSGLFIKVKNNQE